jgi:hypothetical protein
MIKNKIVFAVTSEGFIKVISYECNEPSFIGAEEIERNEMDEVVETSMWNKIYKSVFVADFHKDRNGECDGGWVVDLDNCELLLDLSEDHP